MYEDDIDGLLVALINSICLAANLNVQIEDEMLEENGFQSFVRLLKLAISEVKLEKFRK